MNAAKSLGPSIRIAFGCALVSLMFLGVGCESTPGNGNRGQAVPLAGTAAALPLTALETLYMARSALVALADGSSTNPEADAQEVVHALPVFEAFAERLDALKRSFNSADSTQLWEELNMMGSLYRFNTASFSASELRYFEANQLRGFRNDVNDLSRQVSAYVELYGRLLEAVGDPFSIDILRSNVPALNALTTMSVDLDNSIQVFSENLRRLSRLLESSKFGA